MKIGPITTRRSKLSVSILGGGISSSQKILTTSREEFLIEQFQIQFLNKFNDLIFNCYFVSLLYCTNCESPKAGPFNWTCFNRVWNLTPALLKCGLLLNNFYVYLDLMRRTARCSHLILPRADPRDAVVHAPKTGNQRLLVFRDNNLK